MRTDGVAWVAVGFLVGAFAGVVTACICLANEMERRVG